MVEEWFSAVVRRASTRFGDASSRFGLRGAILVGSASVISSVSMFCLSLAFYGIDMALEM